MSQALGNKLLCLKCLRESNNSFFIAWQFVPYMSIISKCIRYFIDVVVMSFVHESISSCDLTTQLGILPLSPLRDHSFCQELMTQKHGETTNYHNHNNEPQTYYIHKQAIIEVGNMLQPQIKKTTNYNKHKPQKLFLLGDVMHLPKIWLSWVRDCFPTLLSRLKGYMDIDSGWWHRKIFCSRNKWTHLALQPNNMNFNFIKQYILH